MTVHMIKKAIVKYNTVSVLLMLLVNFKYTKSPTRWDDGYFSLTNPLPPAHKIHKILYFPTHLGWSMKIAQTDHSSNTRVKY